MVAGHRHPDLKRREDFEAKISQRVAAEDEQKNIKRVGEQQFQQQHGAASRSLVDRRSSLQRAGAGMIRSDKQDSKDEDQQLSQVRQVFEKWDLDSSGCLSRTEFEKILDGLGFGRAATSTIFDNMDLSGDGKIEFNEFLQWTAGKKQAQYRTIASLDAQQDLHPGAVTKAHRQESSGYTVTVRKKQASEDSATASSGRAGTVRKQQATADTATARQIGPDRERVMEYFRKWDVDGNGMLQEHEMRTALRHSGVRESNISSMISFADRNHDGRIDINEFTAWAFEETVPVVNRQQVQTKYSELDRAINQSNNARRL